MIKNKWIAIGLGLVLVPHFIQAQERGVLDTVVVGENRLRLTWKEDNRDIQIIDRKQIERLPVRSVAELLSYVNGVDFRQRGPGGIQGDLSIDGGTFDESLLLLNGVRISDPQTGHNMMNLPITLDAIDHIEVLRGSAARTYGVNTLTGAVNIITKQAVENNIQLTGYWGSSFKGNAVANKADYNNTGGIFTVTQKSEKLSQLLTVSNNHGNGYRYNTGFKTNTFYYQNKLLLGANFLQMMAGYVNNQFGANGFYASPGDANSGEISKNFIGAISFNGKIAKHWVTMPRFSYRLGNDDYRYVWSPIKYQNIHRTNIYNWEWNNRIDMQSGELGFGVELRQERINSTQLGKYHRENYGATVEYKWKNLHQFDLVTGGYLNYNTKYGWQFFPGVDIGYRIDNHWKTYGTIGTGQRYPTYTDLYYKTPPIYGNANLIPEQSRFGEIGFKYFGKHIEGNAGVFYRRINNFIDWLYDSNTSVYRAAQNQHLNTMGQTINLNYKSENASSAIFRNNLIRVGYTHLNSSLKHTETVVKSRYLLNNLKHQLQLLASTELIPKLTMAVDARWQERLSYKKYFLLDAKLSYAWQHLDVFMNATNLTNITYIEAGALPLPGRWITFGGRLHLK